MPLLALAVLVVASVTSAQDPFAENVRTTPPLSPADEQRTLHVPPGFEVQLVASEPDIAKPLNMAFDAAGRLWITQTREYPFPSHDKKGRDFIKIIEIGPDGRATKVTTFADGLNIPIGIYPCADGHSCIAFSIPEIRRYVDGDGDGHADRTELLYGTFGDNDTHGMTNAFRRGLDGWLYACHGFNNVSHITAPDGSSITLSSGNTYRMRTDGSHVEQFTWGQTNPFGLCFDSSGNLYSADSHSKPIYQLLRGGWYEGIGKTDDGLGFAPPMMHHSHGSSAIGGVVCYEADDFPPEFRGNFFVGNVVTSRVNRDSITYNGSTPVAHEEADFIRSDDPWFRPCDLQLGPDGAIYIADFYNRIIGHYEVPLDHPGRDRERGRIWRVRYRSHDRPIAVPLAGADVDHLLGALDDANLTVRRLATDHLSDRIGLLSIKPIQALLASGRASPLQQIHALWVLHRLNRADPELLAAAAHNSEAPVRIHAMRIAAEIANWTSDERELALSALRDTDPTVRRCGADALGRYPHHDNIPPLLKLLNSTPAIDTHLRYAIRMALRDQLGPAGAFKALEALKLSDDALRAILDVSPAVPSSDAAQFIVEHLSLQSRDRGALTRLLRHAMKYAAGSAIADDAIAAIKQSLGADLELQLELFEAMQTPGQTKFSDAARAWGESLARQSLRPLESSMCGWIAHPIDRAGAASQSPWVLERRASADGDGESLLLCSLPMGEALTGVIRSPAFQIPPTLSFYIAGHNGLPGTSPSPKNRLRLRDASDNRVLIEALPPRHDVAQRVTWDLHEFAGRSGYLEAIDGDDAIAYAWMAFGRLDPPVVPLPKMLAAGPARARAAEIARTLHLTDLSDDLQRLADQPTVDIATRAAASVSLASFGRDESLKLLGQLLADESRPQELREKVAQQLSSLDSDPARAALVAAIKPSSSRMQSMLARSLAASRNGAEALLTAIKTGQAPPRLLQERAIIDSLSASGAGDVQSRIASLAKDLPPVREELQQIIERRRGVYAYEAMRGRVSVERGAGVFARNCSACHQIDGVGKMVGPQLDGIGSRGAERLIEDVLDPNRNLDPSFRYSTLILQGGQTVTGLFRREEPHDVMIFVDATGKDVAVPKEKIQRRMDSNASLMPDNFSTAIGPDDFNDLIAFLLLHRK